MSSAAPFFEKSLLLDFAVAEQTAQGEVRSGDRYLVAPIKRGMLIAVVDGLGHGQEAAFAADLAITTIEDHSEEGVIPLAQRCHAQLARTRGAVMSLLSFDGFENTVTWLGIGNVDGVILPGAASSREPEWVFQCPGLVGYRMPKLSAMVTPISPGDLIILTTDGIRSGFLRDCITPGQLLRTANQILNKCGKESDDSLVLAASYRGWGAQRTGLASQVGPGAGSPNDKSISGRQEFA
jgi:hypothetical protein